MRIIITGGTGLMGRALAESLATDRHDVIVVSRSPEKAILPAGVRAERDYSRVPRRGNEVHIR